MLAQRRSSSTEKKIPNKEILNSITTSNDGTASNHICVCDGAYVFIYLPTSVVTTGTNPVDCIRGLKDMVAHSDDAMMIGWVRLAAVIAGVSVFSPPPS